MLRADLQSFITERRSEERYQSYQNQLFTLVENLQDQLEPEMKGWMQSGGSTVERDLTPVDLDSLRRRSRECYYREPHARVVVRNLVKFIIGSGTIVDFREKDEKANEAISKYWRKFCKRTKWFLFQRECVTRAFRDGEVFVRRIKQFGLPLTLRFIDPEKVTKINFPKNDMGMVVDGELAESYEVTWGNGTEPEPIPADEMLHIKIDVDSNMSRGRPILESLLNYLGKYGKWLDARMALNIVRASVALVQEVKGSPNDLSRLRTAQQAQRNQSREGDKSKMLRSGTIIRGTPGVEYKMLSPNLDARDAAEDGNTLLRGVAAGAGFPDVFVSANYADSNYAATVVSQNTGIREFEDWSNVLGVYFTIVVDWALTDGLEMEEIPAMVEDREIDLDFDITFPPLIRRDITQENSAFQSMNEHRVMSRRTWALRMGLNPDSETKAIEEEEANMPTPPKVTPKDQNLAPKGVADRSPRAAVQVGA